MSYGADLSRPFSLASSGVATDPSNPAQIGYSVNQPLARVRKQTLQDCVNINAVNRVDANHTSLPCNTLGSLQTFTDTAKQFASDLATEGKTFLTGQTVSNIPNYYLVLGGLGLLMVFKLGQGRPKGRRR